MSAHPTKYGEGLDIRYPEPALNCAGQPLNISDGQFEGKSGDVERTRQFLLGDGFQPDGAYLHQHSRHPRKREQDLCRGNHSMAVSSL